MKSVSISGAHFNVAFLMVLFSVLSYFDRTIMSVAGPIMMRDFGISETRMGTIYSAFLLGYALFMIPGGGLADRLGPRRVLVCTGLGASLFTALTASAGYSGFASGTLLVPTLLIVRFLMGVFTAPLYPSCGKMNANLFLPSQQGMVWGFVAAGAGIGSALSPSLFAWMIPAIGWRVSFCLAALATAAAALVWAWYVRDYFVQDSPKRIPAHLFLGNGLKPVHLGKSVQFGRLLRSRNVLLLSVGYLSVGYFEYIFFFWIYYYFGQIRHLSAPDASAYTTAIFLAWVVMSPLGGHFSDVLSKQFGARWGRPIVPVFGILSGAVLLAVGTRLSNSLAVGATLALSFGLASSSDGAFWRAAIEAGGESAGAACGIMNTGSNIGGFIAPTLTPLIASFAGWSAALNFGCATAAAGVCIWFFLRPADPAICPGIIREV